MLLLTIIDISIYVDDHDGGDDNDFDNDPVDDVSSRVIFALGLCMTFINIPVEWFSVGFNWTWMLLFGDIRQGIFYAMLLSFWIIFCGEHLMVCLFTFSLTWYPLSQ